MKITRFIGLLIVALVAAIVVRAAEKEKEVTLTGMGQCAKCSLGKTAECQNAIVVKQDGKEIVYLLAENEVSKKFHDEICDAAKEIKVTGLVKEAKGQKEIVASKIELVKGAAG
jgi:hypothetical protein